ncbi:Histone-Lysine N-Methyltransferase ash1l [Geranomyces michiganensis]|nr:Histone-Lysine N-Methyltransferase ash1l [Geranomyces michiganensis]
MPPKTTPRLQGKQRLDQAQTPTVAIYNDGTIVNVQEDDEEGEVTRCACGVNESYGIMVMCEKCFVWQHCECMNVNDKKLPKHYYCEECKPKGHSYFQKNMPQRTTTTRAGARSGETAAQMHPDNNMMNLDSFESPLVDSSSQESAADAAPPLLGRGMRRLSGTNKSDPNFGRRKNSEPQQSPPADTKPANKRKRQSSGASPRGTTATAAAAAAPPPEPERASKRRAGRHHEPLDTTALSAASDTKAASVSPSSTARGANAHHRDNTTANASLLLPSPLHPPQSAAARKPRRKKPPRKPSATTTTSSRTHTRNSTSPTNITPDNTIHVVMSTTPTLRQSHADTTTTTTAPVKIRIPNAKSSFGEMNKRVKQMSDYITHLQVAMMVGKQQQQQQQQYPAAAAHSPVSAASTMTSLSTSSSSPPGSELPGSSSAALSSSAGTPQMFEMMDHLNLRLIRFQERYGSFSKR